MGWNGDAGGMRWLAVGHGGIVPTFVDAVRGVGHEVVAVAGRDPARARAFADRYQIAEVTDDPPSFLERVDAAYVATPHSSHRDVTLPLLQAGIPVLCEKPMAVNARQVADLVTAAQTTGTFLMEAMWTRHLPVYDDVRIWINQGCIGAPKLVEASFGFRASYDRESRLWSPELAGGSLLDLGIYPLTLADLVLDGPPSSVSAVAELSPDQVDAHLAMILAYPDAGLARLGSAINTRLSSEARIVGDSGTIAIPEFWRAEEATLDSGSQRDAAHRPHRFNGFEYQILEVERCLQVGLTESPVVEWECSLAMAELMDAIRAEVKVSYPADEEA